MCVVSLLFQHRGTEPTLHVINSILRVNTPSFLRVLPVIPNAARNLLGGCLSSFSRRREFTVA